MNQEIKKKWVAALRSGKYKQGTGKLKKSTPDGDRFCCLGVLCDLFINDERNKLITRDRWEFNKEGHYELLGYVGILPAVVNDWAYLDKEKSTPSRADKLTSLNDDHKKSFKEIADIIEKEF
jgi:hypothetical protein